MELQRIRQEFRSGLEPLYPAEEIDSIFYRLIHHYLELPRHILGLEPGKIISETAAFELQSALNQLQRGVPVQYITGRAYFMEMELEVGPGVLIPRPETEELVRWIYESYPADAIVKILDVGTGSGCIPLALAKTLPKAFLYGMDLSPAALTFARRNAQRQGVSILWQQHDVFEPFNFEEPFDIMVSNPPYIPESEAGHMHRNVRDFEPHTALFVPDDNPLRFYRILTLRSSDWLKPGGWLYLEIHENFSFQVEELLRNQGFDEVQSKMDIFGKPRFVRGRRKVNK